MLRDSTYDVLAGGRIAKIRGSGDVAVKAAEVTLRALLADPRLREEFGLLVDARGVARWLTKDEVQELAEIHARLSGGRVRRTALVASPGAQYGTGRELQAYAENHGLEIQVFTDDAQALQWVGEGMPDEPPADGS